MDCDRIIKDYIGWIKDNTLIISIEDGNGCEITTPFLDRHNDHLQIYVRKQGSGYVLTDDGYTIADLNMSGMEINTPKREKILTTVLNGFGVKLGENNSLYVEAESTTIGQKKHYLLQAILTVNDMYVLSQESVYSFFKEDVERFFQANQIYYSKDIKITGKTGFDHNIDFIISASRTKRERLIKTLNTASKDPIMSAIFAFTDIALVRERQTSNFVVYNDVDRAASPDILSALSNYDVNGIPWSDRESFKDQFALN